MAVFRIERTRDYTVMSNHHLRNGKLSLKAKGLLSMMLSLPEEWNYTTMTHDVSVNQQEVKLTRTEYAILKMLMQNPSQVIAKSIMLERISQDTPDCTENSLKIHVSNLRKKLREISGKDYIEAVWGIGFKFTAE